MTGGPGTGVPPVEVLVPCELDPPQLLLDDEVELLVLLEVLLDVLELVDVLVLDPPVEVLVLDPPVEVLVLEPPVEVLEPPVDVLVLDPPVEVLDPPVDVLEPPEPPDEVLVLEPPEPPEDVLVDPVEVDETTMLPPPPLPPKKPPPKKPPPPKPPLPPITTGTPPLPPSNGAPDGMGYGTGGSGMPWVATVTVGMAHAAGASGAFRLTRCTGRLA